MSTKESPYGVCNCGCPLVPSSSQHELKEYWCNKCQASYSASIREKAAHHVGFLLGIVYARHELEKLSKIDGLGSNYPSCPWPKGSDPCQK